MPGRAALACLLVTACSNARAPAPADAGELSSSQATDPKSLLETVDRMRDQLKDKPKTFEVLSALGNLYYENGRFLDAVDTYRLALQMSAPFEDEAQALRDKRVKPARDLPLECRRAGPGYGLVQIGEAARKLDPERKLHCLESVLEMAVADRARRGNALYLAGNPDGALAEHRRVLKESPDYPESLFFVGAIVLEQSRGDKAMLEEGKSYWKRLLVVAPDSPRAGLVRDSLPRADELFARKPEQGAAQASNLPPGHPAVGGQLPAGHPELPAGHPPIGGNAPSSPMAHRGAGPEDQVDPNTVSQVADAVANTERTPELEKGLDKLTADAESLVDQGKYQEARDAIVRVMPMRPNDARTAAVMGAAMRGLGRNEMAERTLSHALQIDPKQPRALFEMGRLLAERGDKAGAADKLRAAQAADPQFAQAHKVAEQLATLR